MFYSSQLALLILPALFVVVHLIKPVISSWLAESSERESEKETIESEKAVWSVECNFSSKPGSVAIIDVDAGLIK